MVRTRSPRMADVLERVAALARTDEPVLFVGGPGVGKAHLATILHACSGRREGPLVTAYAAAIPDSLMESELFGQERGGSLPRAHRLMPGLLAKARGGTLLVRCASGIIAPLWRRLADAVRCGRMPLVGSNALHDVDVRLVLTEHAPADRIPPEVRELVGANVIDVPALRERPEDLGEIIRHVSRAAQAWGLSEPFEVTDDALALLQARPWLGNFRELAAFLARVRVFTGRAIIDRAALAKCRLPFATLRLRFCR